MVERDFVIVCFKTSLLRTGKQKWPIVTFVSSFSGSRLLDNKINSYYYRQTRISLNKKLDRVDNLLIRPNFREDLIWRFMK